MTGKSPFFDIFTLGTATAIYFATIYLFDKIEQHDDEINKLSSRLEKYEKNMNLHKIMN